MADPDETQLTSDDVASETTERRRILSSLGMIGGMAASYGTFAAMAGRFLFPAHPARLEWVYVAPLAELPAGASLAYQSPDGLAVTITRSSDEGEATVSDFIALSSICPNLGCRVHWEPGNDSFFCPCHNGVFDPQGKATSGPPAVEEQDLARYELKIENGLLFIKVPTDMGIACRWPASKSGYTNGCRFLEWNCRNWPIMRRKLATRKAPRP
jgi:Rieske Fe-S protein